MKVTHWLPQSEMVSKNVQREKGKMDISISLTIQNYGGILGLKYAVISEAWPREGRG